MDAKNIFDNIIGKIQTMDDNIDSWRSYHVKIKDYFEIIDRNSEKIHLASNLTPVDTKCNDSDIIWNGVENYNCFLKYVEGNGDVAKNRKIHTIFWIRLRELHKRFKDRIFNRIENEESLKIFDEAADETIDFLKNKNNELANNNKINKRLSKYYGDEKESYKDIVTVVKYIFYFLLICIGIVFLIKQQFSNLKIIFFVLLLFLTTYVIEPIYIYINDLLYNSNRTVVLSAMYGVLLLFFTLFISFKYFVFDSIEGKDEGKRDLYILGGLFAFSAFLVFYNYIKQKFGLASFF